MTTVKRGVKYGDIAGIKWGKNDETQKMSYIAVLKCGSVCFILGRSLNIRNSLYYIMRNKHIKGEKVVHFLTRK